MPKRKTSAIDPFPLVFRTCDVAAALTTMGYKCSARTARRHLPDLRATKGEKQRTYNATEFRHAVQIVQERMRKPSPRRLKKEAREAAEAQQRAATAAKRGRKKH